MSSKLNAADGKKSALLARLPAWCFALLTAKRPGGQLQPIESPQPRPDTALPAAREAPTHVETREAVAGLPEIMSRFGDFGALLKQETERVIVDTEQNAENLMSHLGQVEQGLAGLLKFMSATDSNQRVMQIIERTESQLALSRRLIEEFSQERTQDAGNVQHAMDDIGKVVSDLGRMVQSVRTLSHQTRMLALNATIEAARAGATGAGFAVVAAEVKGLSQQSDKAAVEIGAGIDKLDAVVQASLQTIVGGRVAKEASGFQEIGNAVSELTDNLQNLLSHQRDTLTKVQQENERLADPIMQMIGAIQFQDVVKRRLKGVAASFDRSAEVIAHAEPELSAAALSTRLGALIATTVQELQQNRQDSDAGRSASQGDRQAIELF